MRAHMAFDDPRTNEVRLYMTAPTLTADVRNGIDYKVADLELAEFGRKEIRLAEHEMPGLMALRREYADVAPLKVPGSPARCT